jgi:predicted GNAT family N-acyltransferase
MDLRSRVLREPLGLRYTPEDLARESDGVHIGAFNGDQIQGYLMLLPVTKTVVKMRQVAVSPNLQGTGIGKKLVTFAEDIAKSLGFEEIELHARETAIPFYLALGYSERGVQFIEVTLPHRKMTKHLLNWPPTHLID